MLLPINRFAVLIILAGCLFMHITSCGKQSERAIAHNELPPVARPAAAPDFLRSLSLLYPQAGLYRVEVAEKNSGKAGVILQKTNHPIEDVVRYYGDTLRKHGFTEITHLEQGNGALLQYERQSDRSADKRELVSVDISKLPYAENLVIRIGRSETNFSRSGTP